MSIEVEPNGFYTSSYFFLLAHISKFPEINMIGFLLI